MGRLYLKNRIDELPEDSFDKTIGPLEIQRDGGLKHTLHNLFCKPNPPAINVLSFLKIAIAVCAADKLFLRSLSPDAWTREIHLSIPLCDDYSNTKDILKDCLHFLSGDHWTIDFRKDKNKFNTGCYYKDNFLPDVVCLFSGGTDSLAGAINLLEDNKKVLLVGHHDFSITASTQDTVFEKLQRHYGLNQVRLTRYEVKFLNSQETTTRARSLLFIAIGLAVASSFGDSIPLYVPENGYIGINVPLTSGRLGSYSTRTTHPYYFEKLRDILKVAKVKHAIINSLKYYSKGEVLGKCRNKTLLESIHPMTISCSHPTTSRWQMLPAGNCGYCFPCIIRRASANHAGIDHAHEYLYDSIGTPKIIQAGGDKAVHLKSVLLHANRYCSGKIKPIFEVMKAGSLSHENSDIGEFVAVYKKGVNELIDLISSKGCDEVKRYAGL